MPSATFTTPLLSTMPDETKVWHEDTASRISLEVSDSFPDALSVPETHFLVLVQTNPSPSASCTAILPDGSELELSQVKSSVWLLPPGTRLQQKDGEAGSAFIQYRIPRASLEAFAEYCGKTELSSLMAPQMTSDPVLQLLSRSIAPLLSGNKAHSSSVPVVRYFLYSFFSHLIASYGAEDQGRRRFVGGLSPKHRSLVEHLLSTPQNLLTSAEDLAAHCNLSPAHFARAFRETFGLTVHKHLTQLRLGHAREQLKKGDLSLAQIAQQAGYADQATFTHSFRNFEGVTPGRFRRRYNATVAALSNHPRAAANAWA